MAETKTEGTPFTEYIRRALAGEYECRHAPDDEVEPGEVVLGVLASQEAKNIYSLSRQIFDGMKRFQDSLGGDLSNVDAMSKDEKENLSIKLHQHRSRVKLSSDLFWEMVCTEFPLSRRPNVVVGIREGWKIVIFKRAQGISISDLFAGMQ